jgi:hypothetical protein
MVGLSDIGGTDISGIEVGVGSGPDAAAAAAATFCTAIAIISSSVGIEIIPMGLGLGDDLLLDSVTSMPLSSNDGIDIIPRLLLDPLLSGVIARPWFPFILNDASDDDSLQGCGSLLGS